MPEWRCFHCNEVFTDPQEAAAHFGADELEEAACRLNATENMILKLYREAQDELRQFRTESDATSKTFYAIGADHARALIREEEKGYEKGIRDMRAELVKGPPHMRRWFGLKCAMSLCGGVVDRTAAGKICWKCGDCGREIE